MKSFVKLAILGLATLLVRLQVSAEEITSASLIGQKPPSLELQALLNAPPEARANWDALRGKVVVLEFWGTRCGPCVEEIPHMNELSDAFQHRPVQFIAITEEDEETVQEFLAKKPIHGWVGLTADSSMHRSYGIVAIPLTMIVSPQGKIVAVTHPTKLEVKHLENILAGKDSGLPAPQR